MILVMQMLRIIMMIATEQENGFVQDRLDAQVSLFLLNFITFFSYTL